MWPFFYIVSIKVYGCHEYTRAQPGLLDVALMSLLENVLVTVHMALTHR